MDDAFVGINDTRQSNTDAKKSVSWYGGTGNDAVDNQRERVAHGCRVMAGVERLLIVMHDSRLEVGHSTDNAVFHDLKADCVARFGVDTDEYLATPARIVAFAKLLYPVFFEQLVDDLGNR